MITPPSLASWYVRHAAAIGLLCLGCAGRQGHSSAVGAPRTIRAAAPQGLAVLGAPYDAQFQPMSQESLFRKVDQPREQVLNEMRHDRVVIESAEDLRANASAWSFLSLGGGIDFSRRFAAFRAYQLALVAEIDDSTRMTPPPPGAVYYLWRVYLGHAYEEVVSGNARDFNLNARIDFGIATGNITDFVKRHRLETHSLGRGLVPANGQAIFANSSAEIQAGYSASGPPVPILVEYRQIPGTNADLTRFGWAPPLGARIRFTRLHVREDGTWGSTPWTLEAACSVNDREVEIANRSVWTGRVNAGQSYPMSWSIQLEVFPGDRVSCRTEGGFRDHITDPQATGTGAMEAITIQPGLTTSGRFQGANASASYGIDWSIEVLPPQQP